MILMAVALLGCGGAEGSNCSDADDCRGELYCDGPSEPTACGYPALAECEDSEGCPGDEMCHSVFDSCNADGYGRFCDVGCPLTPCHDGFACGQGICVPQPCTDGFRCSAHQLCDVAAAAALGRGLHWRHGCLEVACDDDDGCDAGLPCVNGFCQTGLGICSPDVAVP